MLEAQIAAIKASGVNVVVSGSRFGDMAEHFLNKHNIMMVKILSKHDIRRLCMAIGAVPLPRCVRCVCVCVCVSGLEDVLA
jgi:T-complex protein 1 subunit theta